MAAVFPPLERPPSSTPHEPSPSPSLLKQVVSFSSEPLTETKSSKKHGALARSTQARSQPSTVRKLVSPPNFPKLGQVTPRGIPRISVADLVLEDGPPTSSYTKAAETLYLSLARHGAAVIEPARDDVALLCRALESTRLYFRKRAESESSPLKPSEWSDRGGYFTAPSKDLYFYKAGRSMNEGLNDFCPPGFPEAFRCSGRVSRLAMSAIARHLKLRGDFFSGLLDDCPLPVGEVSSSVLAATCQRRDPISDHFKPDDAHGRVSEASETEKGLLMLVTADFPGLQVCNSEGVWSPADQGVPPGSLLLLAGRCLHRATAGLCPASTYRVLPPASAGATRCSLSFRLMPRPSAPIDCSSLIHAGHAVPSSMRAVVHAGPFLDSLSSYAHDPASESKESSMAVACKLEKASLSSMVVDPASGSLLEDAMIAPCGHSFGGATLSRVIDSMLCPYCMASVDTMTLIPNLAMRSVASCFRPGLSHGGGVKVPKRKRVKEFGEGKDPSEAVKRRPKTEDAMLASSFEGDTFGRPKGVQFPFSVNDKVLIKGNKRTPEKFFGREAIITSQCLNGWYLVRMLDSGESVRLQYRSLQKSDGTPLETGDARLSSSPDAQMERKAGADSTERWWESKPAVGEMSALLQEDDKDEKLGRPLSLALGEESVPRPCPGGASSSSLHEQPPLSSTPNHPAVRNAVDTRAAPRESQAYLGAHGSSLAKQTQALIAAAAAMEEESREATGDDCVSGGNQQSFSPRANQPSLAHEEQNPGVVENRQRGVFATPDLANRQRPEQAGPLPLWMSPITATSLLHQAISDGANNSGHGGGS